MLKAAFDGLVQLVRNGDDPRRCHLSQDEYLLRDPGTGEWRVTRAGPRPRAASFTDLEDLASAIVKFGDPATTNLYFSAEQGVVAVLDDDAYREQRLSLKLHHTPAFGWLRELSSMTRPWDHRALMMMLRVESASAMDPDVLLQLGSLVTKLNASGTSKLGAGTEALGKSVQREVGLEGNPVPSSLTFRCDVFQEFRGHSPSVDAVFEVSFTESGDAEFRLRPVPEHLVLAEAGTLLEIKDVVRGYLESAGGAYGMYLGWVGRRDA